jgi:flagellar protein FliL
MKADPKAAEAPAPKSSKKMMVIAGAVVLLGAIGGGTAWFMTKGSGAEGEHKEVKKAEKPEFVVLDQFTVNLQPENGDQYLQIAMTLQLGSLEQVELIKLNMARVRSRVLLLLSSKKASELSSTEGKDLLAKQIIAAVNQPFAKGDKPQEVRDVLFTSFIIQ